MFEADESVCTAGIDLTEFKTQSAAVARRNRTKINSRNGRYFCAARVRDNDTGFDVAIDATLRAAALRAAQTGMSEDSILSVRPEDLRKKLRKESRTTLIIFVVDASDSMSTQARMAAAKGAVLALLTRAYQSRNRVALIVFEGERARVLLHPTTSVALARERLRRLPTGGETPFADGLLQAWRMIQAERLKEPDVRPLLVVISDGEANVALEEGRPYDEEVCSLAESIRKDGIQSIAIDTTPTLASRDKMKRIAEALDAAYHPIDRLRAANVLEALRSHQRY